MEELLPKTEYFGVEVCTSILVLEFAFSKFGRILRSIGRVMYFVLFIR